jgi:hypothetical protein
MVVRRQVKVIAVVIGGIVAGLIYERYSANGSRAGGHLMQPLGKTADGTYYGASRPSGVVVFEESPQGKHSH